MRKSGLNWVDEEICIERKRKVSASAENCVKVVIRTRGKRQKAREEVKIS